MPKNDVVDILLVEDNPQDVVLMLRALKKRNIANPIQVVTDGAEALDFIFCRGAFETRDLVNLPRVILLDLKLPKVNGLEVLEKIRADERTKTIPVVVVTSSKEDPDVKSAYALGANSYIVKPLDFESFVESMSTLGFYWLMMNQPPQ